jgi:hypothetical protein
MAQLDTLGAGLDATVMHWRFTAANSLRKLHYCGGVIVNRLAKWNGANWSLLGSGVNESVNSLIVFNNELVAGGEFTTAGGIQANRIAKWNGTNWSALGVGVGNGEIYSLAVHGTGLIVGGSFTNIGGIPVNRIARWDGSTGHLSEPV